MPWLMVRLPCGSMSTQSTRWRFSANAAARFSVVVVLATPPFWLAKAMTCGVVGVTAGSGSSLGLDRRTGPLSCGRESPSACAIRMGRWRILPAVPALFDKRLVFVTGKGGVGKTTVAAALGAGRRPRGQAHDRLRGRPAGADRRAPSAARAVGPRETAARRHLYAVSIDPAGRARGVPRGSARLAAARRRCSSPTGSSTTSPPRRPGARELATIGKVWELAQPAAPPQQRLALRPRDRRRARSAATGSGCSARRARSATRSRVGTIRRQAGTIHAFLTDRADDRRRRRRAAGGDAGQRDDRVSSGGSSDEMGMETRPGRRERACCPSASPPTRPSRSRPRTVAPGAGVRAALRARHRARAGQSQRSQLRRLQARRSRRRCHRSPTCSTPDLDLDAFEQLADELEKQAVVSVERLLEGKRIVVCAGAGRRRQDDDGGGDRARHGRRGLKVAVLTIDPAKRLANSLGLEELGNEQQLVDPSRFADRRYRDAAASCGR